MGKIASITMDVTVVLIPCISVLFCNWRMCRTQSRCLFIEVMDYIPRGELFGVWKRMDYFSEHLVRIYVAELAMVLGKKRLKHILKYW